MTFLLRTAKASVICVLVSIALTPPLGVAQDVTVAGNLSLTHSSDPAKVNDPVKLEISGPIVTGLDGDPGMWLNYTDAAMSIATFGLNRLQGEWHWQIATEDPDNDRLQMTLGNSNALTLFDPTDPEHSIVIDPLTATISINGSQVLSQANLSGLALSGGLSVLSGYVGIGTSSPEQMLDVEGQIRLRDMIRVEVTTVLAAEASYNSWDYHEVNDSYFRAYSVNDGGSAYPRYLDIVAGGGNQWSTMRFITQNYGSITEKMRITPDGKVGIGTTTPQAKLDVAGVVHVQPGGDIPMFDPNN